MRLYRLALAALSFAGLFLAQPATAQTTVCQYTEAQTGNVKSCIGTQLLSGTATPTIDANGLYVIERGTSIIFESSANLGNGAGYIGAARDAYANMSMFGGVGTGAVFFGCQFNSDQAGTARVDNSTDATTWYVAATAPVVAGTALDLNVRLRARYQRCVLINGATPTTALRVVSSFTLN